MLSTRARLGVLVAVLAVASGSVAAAAWMVNVLASGEEPGSLVASLDIAAPMPAWYEQQPRALTDRECSAFRPVAFGLWDANVEAAREAGMAPEELEAYRTRLNNALDRTQAWLDAGCPDDDVLGTYERVDGGPAVIRLFDWPPPEVALTFVPAGIEPTSGDAKHWFGTELMR